MRVIMVLLGTIILLPLVFIGVWALVVCAPILLVFGLPLVGLGYFVVSKRSRSSELRHFKVLVVDDDEASVTMLLSLLEARGADVDYVDTGKAMTDRLIRNEYDLVFLDSKMPEQSGEDALLEADALAKAAKRIPIVFYTGSKDVILPARLTHFYVRAMWLKTDLANLPDRVAESVEEASSQSRGA